MLPFTQKAIEVIKAIPEGYVMTYGQVAEIAGSKRGARQVVRILHSLSKIHNLPWYRVVNAKGEIAIHEPEGRFLQEMHLSSEGVQVNAEGKIDLDTYRYVPAIPPLA